MKKVFTKFLAVVIAVMLILSACPVAFAADDDIASGTAGDGINWVLDSSNTLTISGDGEIVVGWYAPPWYDYKDSILNVVVEEGITAIPDTAFCFADNLVSVSIPASVTDIGDIAFWQCYSLREINVDPDNTVFTGVDGIVFTKDKTKLCFYPANKAGETYTIPDTVTTIGTRAFGWNRTLKKVVIPDTVTTLEQEAFSEASIKSVTIGNGIKTITRSCFNTCGYLESIVIPDSVEAIEYDAFWGCSELKTVTIGAGVKTIAGDIFRYCDALTAIHYTGTADAWGEIAIDQTNDILNNQPVHYMTEDDYKEGIYTDCTTNGHTGGLYCEECDAYVTGEVTEYAWGHNLVDGVCETCDFEIPEIKVGETGTVYIENADAETYIKFVAETSGEYILTSDNGGDDDSIDPYVSVYDGEFEEIGYDDDDDNSYNFALVFNADAGETYFFGLSAYNSDVEYTYTLDKYIAITHQPTAAEPYVELNDDTGATYKWFAAEYGYTEITDKNADTVSYEWGTTSYNAENGWTGVNDYWQTADCFDFFTIPLKAGDIVAVEVTGDYKDGAGLYYYGAEVDNWQDLTDDSTYVFTIEIDGNYTFYTISDSGDVTVRAHLVNVSVNEINGETGATLKNPVIGTNYVCGVNAQGKVLVSDMFEYAYAITHQPTAAEPYVELNEQGDVKYQWYKAERGYGEITDEDVDPTLPMDMGESTYDEQSGWTGVLVEAETVYLFTISLKAGDEVELVADGNATNASIFMPAEGSCGDDAEFDETGSATLTAPVDGEYYVTVSGDADATVRAYADKYVYTAIDGQTTNVLTDATIGTIYACKITAGEDVLTSDTFEYTYAITHQPTRKEPYVEVNDDTDATYQWYTVEGEYDEITYTAIEGETAAELANPANGATYVCEVTFADGSRETSAELGIYYWQISVNETGVYALEPNSNYVGKFSADKIAVYDKQYNEVLYYEKLGGFPLVKGQTYTVEFTYDFRGEISGELEWTAEIKATKIFPDTTAGDWYSDAVTYAVGRGTMTGYASNGKFGTSDSIQRQDFLVMLARFDGVDLTRYGAMKSQFPDVTDGSYYEAAVNWGSQNGIVTGYDEGEFGVGDKVTREQLVTFLYRYAKYKGLDVELDSSTEAKVSGSYTDYKNVSGFAKEAVLWAIENGVISGKTATTIVPQGNAQRCEVAKIVYNIFLNDVF